MITPSFGLTATERILPKLALDFTTATLDPRITFTRSGNTATYTNSSGVITAINANLPRFDYNPTTLICQGLLIEESRKNLFLNSLIDGTNLTTQIVTTTATATTISFYGTGSIVLSGTHSATISGTGAYPSRKTYTFTPTAGALTCTVSGTVQYAQIEAGAFATSFIPTDATVGGITRNADVATMTGTNLTNWYNTSNVGTLECQFIFNAVGTGTAAWDAISITNNAGTGLELYKATNGSGITAYLGSSGASLGVFASGSVQKIAIGQNSTISGAASRNAGSVTSVATGAYTATTLTFGGSPVVASMCGYIQKVNYWPQKLTDAELQAFSK